VATGSKHGCSVLGAQSVTTNTMGCEVRGSGAFTPPSGSGRKGVQKAFNRRMGTKD